MLGFNLLAHLNFGLHFFRSKEQSDGTEKSNTDKTIFSGEPNHSGANLYRENAGRSFHDTQYLQGHSQYHAPDFYYSSYDYNYY